MLFRVIAPRLDNVLPDKLSPGATLTIKGQDLDLMESGILYRQILGNKFSWKLDIIERHGANELLVRLPAAESILADIAGTFTRNQQLIYKVKLNPAAYLAGPATISLWSSQTTTRQTNEVHITLLEPDGTSPRPETRVAAITSGSVNQVSFGDQITLYGENLDVICQIYIRLSYWYNRNNKAECGGKAFAPDLSTHQVPYDAVFLRWIYRPLVPVVAGNVG